ncbi:MAG: Clp protease N-terminal domain-containing protein [Candidatus Dormibacteria bacterium]
MQPFERFSESSKAVLTLAQEEAQRDHYSYIRTEHLLLGILAEGDGPGARVLRELGLEVEMARSAITAFVGDNQEGVLCGAAAQGKTKQVIECAVREAERTGASSVGTDHLLLGILLDGQGVAAKVLQERGIGLETVRDQLVRFEEQRLAEAGDRRPHSEWTGYAPGADASAADPGIHQIDGVTWEHAHRAHRQPRLSFERFTEKAKRVLTLAQDEAEKSHHSYIGTEHLLLGLLREGEGLAAKVLANLGIEIDRVRDTIDSVLGRNERIIVEQIIPTSRVKKVIDSAVEEAKQRNCTYVGTEHLLLGLLIEGEGIAAHVLEDLGANLDKARHELDSLLENPGQWTEPVPEGSTRGLPGSKRAGGDELGEGYAAGGPLVYSAPAHGHPGRFTAEARSALALAEEEAVRSAAGHFGTEHLVVGLLRQGAGRAATALLAMGVGLAQARAALAALRPASPPVQTGWPTPGLGRLIREAEEAVASGQGRRIDTGHLLLAAATMLHEPGARLLQALGVTGDAVRQRLVGSEDDEFP